MITGAALMGSSTPPTCAAALRCTRLPTCAQEPTRACESIIVAFIDVGADVDEHGRHADHGGRHVGAFANRRSAGHEANTIGEGEAAGGEGVFVDKREYVSVGHLLQFAQTETEKDALLDPGVDDPASVDFLGGANLAASQGCAEVKKNGAGFVGVGDGFVCRQALNGRLQRGCDSCLR